MANSNYMNLKTRVQKQQKKTIRKIRFYHSFLTIVLLLCVVQISYSALLNLAKIVVYQTKIVKAQELHSKAQERNQYLKSEIKNFSSMHKVESIARNNLKMAAKDEVLIIINQPAPITTETKKVPNNGFTKFLETFSTKFNKDIEPDKISE
ncbi:MAG: septum formation initiator family protein [Candidatus Gastranaerophilales bacterium]|nr:septum formation initiator family protein [Candidatus Gastranaerophilales bacterium]